MTQRTDDAIATIRFEVASLQADLRDARTLRDELAKALREARADILYLANQRWSEIEGTDEQHVGYIDATLAKLDAKP